MRSEIYIEIQLVQRSFRTFPPEEALILFVESSALAGLFEVRQREKSGSYSFSSGRSSSIAVAGVAHLNLVRRPIDELAVLFGVAFVDADHSIFSTTDKVAAVHRVNVFVLLSPKLALLLDLPFNRGLALFAVESEFTHHFLKVSHFARVS